MAKPPNRRTPAGRFSTGEKLFAQLTFQVMAISGVMGIARRSWLWAAPYAVLYGYGVHGIVMRHLSYPRCPHLYVHHDCLQFPSSWTLRLVKRRKTEPFTARERWTFYTIMALLATYPIPWLRKQPRLLAPFTTGAAAWYLAQAFSFCRRCRTTTCPFNRSAEAGAD